MAMHGLVPYPVLVPLLGAASLAAANKVLPRWAVDALTLACAIATLVLCALLASGAGNVIVYWFGGFHPRGGVAVGISFSVDRLGAGMATLVGVMVCSAIAYSLRYFEEVGALFGALMLVFLAAMVGFCLTGDLFDLFVFFELMSVAAYALTAYKIEEAGPLQGAINFAITNSVGSFLMLTGIALLYGRTGALNMAQIATALAGHPADGLVEVSLLLIMCGLLIKAAIVPLHFWLADAHAVAPVPVCVLFSGVMVELALYGLARVYWTVLSAPLASHAEGLRATLIILGVVTALVGAVMCVAQRHIKRLLAFSTISHTGTFLIGLGLLTPAGLAAASEYVVEHALLKGSLFMGAGILLHRFGSVDEHDLRGRGRGRDAGLWVAAIVFAGGGLGLAALPPLGSFFGKSALEATLGDTPGYGWVIAVLVISSALTAGTILRVAGRVFAGWGPALPRHHELLSAVSEMPETLGPHDRTPPPMVAMPALLLLGGLVAGLVSPLRDAIGAAAAAMADRAGYVARVLGGHAGAGVPAPHPTVATSDILLATLTVAGALLVAALALRPPEGRWATALGRVMTPAMIAIRRLHSGCVNDYVAWVTAGAATIGGALLLS
ncbi:MAG TPA: proton-conducting transporter membrane subunit [Solirubrobacteraceae bacterium]|jgi:multicomponent Na+:H+ antiporter subunit D|nr:proton-conducting transporter membrane subunit [Solirubrobacteraceae bacterium]